ncbi:hypothetical protein [Candidatus Nitrospira allomarina]|jgi:hypothetical protein|uniref:Uncharacterized protein n=1 Tax=Candidatus Nitrospira allomarina TaxID=3020900 RepID=A0AA96GCI6_9BACT|nr:hypothetical protein [Candidatus Nitrospira allomarina]WNM57640.1 hypothetical protein PP769_16970 [Candidatus Nitrospira allomarina]
MYKTREVAYLLFKGLEDLQFPTAYALRAVGLFRLREVVHWEE